MDGRGYGWSTVTCTALEHWPKLPHAATAACAVLAATTIGGMVPGGVAILTAMGIGTWMAGTRSRASTRSLAVLIIWVAAVWAIGHFALGLDATRDETGEPATGDVIRDLIAIAVMVAVGIMYRTMMGVLTQLAHSLHRGQGEREASRHARAMALRSGWLKSGAIAIGLAVVAAPAAVKMAGSWIGVPEPVFETIAVATGGIAMTLVMMALADDREPEPADERVGAQAVEQAG